MLRCIMTVLAAAILMAGCSTGKKPEPKVEYYDHSFRQLPPEPTYNRLAWSHPPQPLPEPAQEKAPLIQPVISFEFPSSNLAEAIQALAQTIGYRWAFPPEIGTRKVSIKQVGTVDEILREIGRQAGVRTELDHSGRMVRVVNPTTLPQLPHAGR